MILICDYDDDDGDDDDDDGDAAAAAAAAAAADADDDDARGSQLQHSPQGDRREHWTLNVVSFSAAISACEED
eukprot:9433970-Karenia_brevis.AAC.1